MTGDDERSWARVLLVMALVFSVAMAGCPSDESDGSGGYDRVDGFPDPFGEDRQERAPGWDGVGPSNAS